MDPSDIPVETDGPYTIEDGRVIFSTSTGRRLEICDEGEMISVAYDPDVATMLKHGAEANVEAWAAKVRPALAMAPQPDGVMVSLDVLTFPARQDTLEEVNACIAVSNRVSRLRERLERMEAVGAPAGAALN